MTDQNIIEVLLDRWQDEIDAGRTPDLKRLYADHPDLIPELQIRIAAFQKMDRGLKKILGETMPQSGVLEDDDNDTALIGNPLINATVRYRVRSKHAKGGLGEVLIAEDEVLGRQVALKRMQGDAFRDPVRRQRFQREALITGQLDHPGIVAVHSFGEDAAGSPCYAMKFVEGQSLDQHARELHESFARRTGHDLRDRRLFESTVLRPLLSRFVSVCNTIAFAHSRNVIHRDIKPANVMLGDFGATFVVDWGLAKKCEEHRSKSRDLELPIVPQTNETLPAANSVTANSRMAATVMRDSAAANTVNGDSVATDEDALLDDALTRTGSVMGTPAYMSPEQATGDSGSIGPASDIYSLGATLYFILTGRTAIASSGDINWIDQVRRSQFPRPREVQPLIQAGLESVCLKAMATNPSDRYSSAVELSADIDRWLADEPLLVHPESLSAAVARFTRRHRAWTQAITAAITVVAVIAIVFAVLLNKQKKIADDRSIAATQAEAKANKLAEQKSQLAEQEARARKVADEQSQLALTTLKSVVLNISRKLNTVSGASEVRQALLKTSIDGLNKVARTLDTRTESERHLAIAHNDIGRTYLLAGNVEGTDSTAEALRHYEKANEISAKLAELNPDDPELQRDLSVSYEYIGDVQQQLGELAKAEDAYLKGLLISEKQIAINPNDPDLKRNVAFGYEKLGDIRIAHEKLPLAREAYVRSFELYSENVKALPGNSTVQRDLLVGQSKLGNIYFQEGNLERASEIYRQCIVTCSALEKIPKSGAQLRDRSLMQNKLGSVLQKQSLLEEAAAAYGEGLEIARRCLANAPDDLTARRDLSTSLNNVGDLLLLQEKLEESRSHYTESLELRRQIRATDESSHVAKIDVAQGLLRLADLELKANQAEKAREFLNEAMGILTPLKDANLLQSAADQLLLKTVQEKLAEAAPQI